MIGLLQPSLENVCKLPVPQGYTQSQIHPSICYLPQGWNGYTHWMFSTPWGSNDEENPCLYYANRNADGTHPTVFIAHPNNPIVPKPPGVGEYNADNEIVFDPQGNGGKGRMYMYWKDTSIRNEEGKLTGGWYRLESDNGMDWTNLTVVKYTRAAAMTHAILKGKLRAYFFNANSNALRGDTAILYNLEVFEMNSIADTTFFDGLIKGSCRLLEDWQPWHPTTFTYKDKVYMIANAYRHNISSKTQSFLYVSEDGINFSQYSRIPFCAYLDPYRATAFVDEDNNLVVYQAVQGLPKLNEWTTDGKGLCFYQEKMDNVLNMLKE